MKAAIIVYADLPDSIPLSAFQEYVTDAVRGWAGSFELHDPLRNLAANIGVKPQAVGRPRGSIDKRTDQEKERDRQGYQEFINEEPPSPLPDPDWARFIEGLDR